MDLVFADFFITTICHLWLLKQVEQLVGPVNMNKIRSSCLRKLFNISGEFKSDPLVYRILICSMERSSEGRGSKSFRVSSRPIEFTLKDFVLVSGLPFHTADYLIPITYDFHNLVFGRKSTLVFYDISKKIVEECSKDRVTNIFMSCSCVHCTHVDADTRPLKNLN